MKRNLAVVLFLIACILIAVLLITRVTTPTQSGILFAAFLLLFGFLSRGFTRK